MQDLPSLNNQDEQLRKLSRDLANFIALIEQSDQKFSQRLGEIGNQTQGLRSEVQTIILDMKSSLQQIDEAMKAAEEMLTEVGAARWRIMAEETLRLGQNHVEALENALLQFTELSEKNLNRLERLTFETEKRVSKVLSSLVDEQNQILDDFRSQITRRFDEIQRAGRDATEFLRTFRTQHRIEIFIMAMLSALITSFLMGLFINAEWPWESYHRAHMERQIGKSVMSQQQAQNPSQVQNQQK